MAALLTASAVVLFAGGCAGNKLCKPLLLLLHGTVIADTSTLNVHIASLLCGVHIDSQQQSSLKRISIKSYTAAHIAILVQVVLHEHITEAY